MKLSVIVPEIVTVAGLLSAIVMPAVGEVI